MALMLTRLLHATASSQLGRAVLSALLILCALLAWQFHQGDKQGVASEKRGARNLQHTGGTRMQANKDDLNQRVAGKNETQPSALKRGDSDRDGIPDAAELASFNDRENFRLWFAAIAEMQFYRMSDEWSAEQRDCAGLVRFSWREALRRHDRRWFQKMGAGYEPFAPDIRSYTLESGPLGAKLFRTTPASSNESDAAGVAFSEFADARSLKDFNCAFIGRDRRRARSGDLLFFFQPWAQKLPYHVMIFLGEARMGSDQTGRDWVVYHTGASALDAGEMKKVRLGVLDRHPDKRWRPVESNSSFLGFYRLKILD